MKVLLTPIQRNYLNYLSEKMQKRIDREEPDYLCQSQAEKRFTKQVLNNWLDRLIINLYKRPNSTEYKLSELTKAAERTGIATEIEVPYENIHLLPYLSIHRREDKETVITQNQAHIRFHRANIDRWLMQGKIECQKQGRALVYSLPQIKKAAENQQDYF